MRRTGLMVAMLVVVASCSESAAEPVDVTGTETCHQTAQEGELKVWYECEDQATDPRVSGTAAVSVVLQQTPPTAMYGTLELVNDDGAWVGDWTGEVTQASNHIADAVLVGTGDYEGLQYHVHYEGVDYPLAITGTIKPSE